jgi:hypothetical protein
MYMRQFLNLIQVVNENYKHIDQLDKLIILLNYQQPSVYLNQEEIDKLVIIAKTTYNSYYDYKVYTDVMYQNPDNHVDFQLQEIEVLGI